MSREWPIMLPVPGPCPEWERRPRRVAAIAVAEGASCCRLVQAVAASRPSKVTTLRQPRNPSRVFMFAIVVSPRRPSQLSTRPIAAGAVAKIACRSGLMLTTVKPFVSC